MREGPRAERWVPGTGGGGHTSPPATGASGTCEVLIAGGGTGGHLFPGLALAEALRELAPGLRVVFAGRGSGIEARVVPAAGFGLVTIPARQARGGGVVGMALGLAVAARGLAHALALLGRLRPGLVVGAGGYTSAGPVLAAALRRVPILLLEQNAVPGAANRLLGRLARRICLGFAEAVPFFPPGRARHTGNPVRAEVVAAAAARQGGRAGGDTERCRLLVFGGSAGAHRLNTAVIEALERLGSAAADLAVRHQTGERDLAMVGEAYARLGLRAEVTAFVSAMGAAYAEADLVLCRAGATSLAELAVAGLPAILVPYPHAADDHQRRNAEVFARAGAAVMVGERELGGARLAGVLGPLARDRERRRAMAQHARALARPGAARAVAGECLALLGR